MGRGRRSFLDDLAVLPWPVGLSVGLLGFLAVRHGILALLSPQGGPLTQGFAQCNHFSIVAIAWRNFDRLVGEAFCRQSYALVETELGGADGGIDPILRKGGKPILVQCEHWKREQVPVNVVCEMCAMGAPWLR